MSETVATNPPEGFFCPPAARSDCFSAGGAIRRLQARDSGWDIAVTIFFGTDHPLPEQVAAADAELARLQLPHARTTPAPQAASCRRPTGTDYYDTTVSPSSGPAGTTVTVSGRLPTLSESGREIGQTATEVVAYWNLDLDHWPSITTAHPVAAVARSPVKFLGTENVAGRCTYRARLTIPQAPPGTYPVEVLYGDPHGGASFAPADFQVTKS